MTESGDQTVTCDIGFGRPPRHAQSQKGVSGNPHGRKIEHHFVAPTFHMLLFSGVAPFRKHRTPTCPKFEARVSAAVSKAIESDGAAFREVMEWTRDFGIGMESQLETRKLSLELQNHLMASRRR